VRTCRTFLRVVLLLLITLISFVWLWLDLLLLLPLPKLRRAGRNLCFRSWSRLCLRVLGGRLHVVGTPPSAPFFLVSNHLSYVDILVMAACLDAYFVAKLEIRAWPLFGTLCRSVGTIFVDRDLRRDVLRVNQLIAGVLEQRYGVILYPEGTSTQGYRVDPFRSALLDYPARNEMPVHVAAVSYRTPPGELPAHLAICWWGDSEFLPHVRRLLGVGRFEATLVFREGTVVSTDRKQLAARLEEATAEVFVPVVAPEDRAVDPGV
jgi:1-acyl-sn-glycerol-3-phosphate acyltransferase